ncbi:hypothetical protein RF11_02836 [Thelohanellus kitauei]|uniref:Uncharacterized protein n=1 Tax=Thelohanellus kitauei TaxID=669202 RepID=A0A0C2J0X9_THEKT|nr:hypothetical protein RF11_02836 [Thelohanellus kitauei]
MWGRDSLFFGSKNEYDAIKTAEIKSTFKGMFSYTSKQKIIDILEIWKALQLVFSQNSNATRLKNCGRETTSIRSNIRSCCIADIIVPWSTNWSWILEERDSSYIFQALHTIKTPISDYAPCCRS